ncbi:restriction endonuclease subunit S [Mycoplasma sp. 125]|uniref:restriction endonuclease subunit S n=1 Tax=Mycoplasma sp. 125 TaxID=3447505 RepID=UPI003F65EA12
MSKNNMVPSIRFKEFTNAWEQERLGEIAKITNGKSNSNDSVKNGAYPFYIRSEEIRRSNKYLYDEEAIITIGEGNIGKVFHYVNGKFDLHQRCYKISNFNSNIYGKFFYYYFSQNFYKRAITDSSKATVDSIRLETITGMAINIPILLKEQIKISTIFDFFNTLITLHQRKLNALENIKKTLLEKMFADEKSAFPSIRFKEFTNAWEQERLENICDRFDNYRVPISEKNRIKGNTPYYGANGIQDYVKGYTHSGENILIAEDGANDVNNYSILYVNEKIWVNNHAHVIKTNNKLNNNFFISLSLKRVDWSSLLVGGERFKLNASTLMNIFIKICNINEQSKISIIFNNINTLITLHQRKLNALEKIKKNLIRKDVCGWKKSAFPSIRFKEFTNAWEQERLGEIAKITNGKSNSNDSVKNGAYPFYIRSEEIRRSNKYLYDEEAIITIGEGNIGKVFHYVNGKFDLHQRCYKISNFNSNIYGKFFYYYFSQNFYKRAITDSSKATVDSIRLETITGMAINIPILLKEQIKISTIFDFFNTLITLHQRKLNALENIKKTLLEKMFV